MRIEIGSIEMFKKGKSDVKENKRYNIAILQTESELWQAVEELRKQGINVSKLAKRLLLEFYKGYRSMQQQKQEHQQQQ